MIIDSHCHAGKGDGLTGPFDTSAPLDKYMRRAERAGIEKTVIFPVFNSDYSLANDMVAGIIASAPDRFFGFAFVHPVRDRGRVHAMVERSVTQYGFCGIKAHRHDGNITREICEAARSFSLPVIYDVMDELPVIELLSSEYPDVNFIIPHMGSFRDDWRTQTAIIDQTARHPNIHTDTSGVRNFDILSEAVRRAGAHKVLFGSDGPWLHPGVELAKVRALGLPDSQEELVLGGNLLRLTRKARQMAGTF